MFYEQEDHPKACGADDKKNGRSYNPHLYYRENYGRFCVHENNMTKEEIQQYADGFNGE